MMSDGGPAFPFVFTQLQPPKVVGGQSQQITTVVPGMTKREVFAAVAMQAFVSRTDGDWTAVAPNAYQVADAMLAELERKPDAGTNDSPR